MVGGFAPLAGTCAAFSVIWLNESLLRRVVYPLFHDVVLNVDVGKFTLNWACDVIACAYQSPEEPPPPEFPPPDEDESESELEELLLREDSQAVLLRPLILPDDLDAT